MIKIKFILLPFLIIFFVSCESDKSKIEKCNDIVKAFVSNLPLDNYEILYKYYPDFRKVKKYWKISDMKITNSIIDEDKTVSIIGTSQSGNILFNLKNINGKYIIANSKGLSAVFNTSLYRYCKAIGCIGASDFDKDISEVCSEKENEFNNLVYSIKDNIETNVIIQNNNLSKIYGYVSGDVTVKNNSRFSIPGRCYEMYFNFLNSNGDIVFTKKEMFNYEHIAYGQSITQHLMESNSGDFQKIKVDLKITSTDFIEKIIAENIKGSNCKAENN